MSQRGLRATDLGPECGSKRVPLLAQQAERVMRRGKIGLGEVQPNASIEGRPPGVRLGGPTATQEVEPEVLHVGSPLLFGAVARPERHTLGFAFGHRDSGGHLDWFVRSCTPGRSLLACSVANWSPRSFASSGVAEQLPWRPGVGPFLALHGRRDGRNGDELKEPRRVKAALRLADQPPIVKIALLVCEPAADHAVADPLVAHDLNRSEVRPLAGYGFERQGGRPAVLADVLLDGNR